LARKFEVSLLFSAKGTFLETTLLLRHFDLPVGNLPNSMYKIFSSPIDIRCTLDHHTPPAAQPEVYCKRLGNFKYILFLTADAAQS
jgi:hypothetical protein